MEKMTKRSKPQEYKVGFDTFLSTFTFRYGSPQMRRIWSQQHIWRTARDVWFAVAQTQQEAGLVTQTQVNNLKENIDDISVERILELEKEKGHDVVAAIAEYGEVATQGGQILHNGLTSEDVLSNAEIKLIHESLELIKERLQSVLGAFGNRIEETKDLVCMGYTHLQAAEPTTYGYRFAKYAQDLLKDHELLTLLQPLARGKGIKGPVGTSASVANILQETSMTPEEHEQKIMERLGLFPELVTDQTYPRKTLFIIEFVLASIGQSLHRFALDMQVLQSSPIAEISEPRRRGQKGSSAMPNKANPISAENIDALTEDMPGILAAAWTTGAFVTLERTLRDSAGKRDWLPKSFLIIDEALLRCEKLVSGLAIHKNAVAANLEKFAPYAALEIILGKLTNAGFDRQGAHDKLVAHAEKAVEIVRSGKPNPLLSLILADKTIVSVLGEDAFKKSFEDILHHKGDASERAQKLADRIRDQIQ